MSTHEKTFLDEVNDAAEDYLAAPGKANLWKRINDAKLKFEAHQDHEEEDPEDPVDPGPDPKPDPDPLPEPEPPKGSKKPWKPCHGVLNDENVILTHDADDLIGALKVSAYWRHVEPKKGQYEFKEIWEKVNRMEKRGKIVFVTSQVKAFNHAARELWSVPGYVVDMGGLQTATRKDNGNPRAFAKIRHPGVQERIILLHEALLKEFQGSDTFHGIIMPETSSIGGKEAKQEYPEYYRGLRNILLETTKLAKQCHVLQYGNWLIGAPDSDKDMLALMEDAYKSGAGFGGPDLMPSRKTTASKYFPKFKGKMPLCIDNQRADLVGVNPQAAFKYAVDDPNGLHCNWIFWETWHKGTWDFKNIVEVLRENKARINTEKPENLR